MPFPESLETERLPLRRWTLDDADAMDAIWRERDVWSALRPDLPFDPTPGRTCSTATRGTGIATASASGP